MLKRIVDESSWGKYDFMYLRIDFANDCNVGYAFINFVDPLDIIDFVNKRANKRWNCFRSDKIAEISYASKFDTLTENLHLALTIFSNSGQGLPCPEVPQQLCDAGGTPLPAQGKSNLQESFCLDDTNFASFTTPRMDPCHTWLGVKRSSQCQTISRR